MSSNINTEGFQQEKVEINLESILPSLAKNLYGDDWRVSIRELLQNAQDAITMAVEQNVLLPRDGRIKVVADPGTGTLIFEDNGIGMSLEDIKNYLATVGGGSKRVALERMATSRQTSRQSVSQLIGQYGIGFLSCFIIADQVTVVTRMRGSRDTGIRAIFTGETRWFHKKEAVAFEGTRIILRLKQEKILNPETGDQISLADLINPSALKLQLRRFGDLLPAIILLVSDLEGKDPGEACNSQTGPWEDERPTASSMLDFLKIRHPEANQPMSPTPFAFNQTQHQVSASGVLYFPTPPRAQINSSSSVSQVEVFCRRMFISNVMPALLPPWATFVGIIVECPDLTPTLNRNDVIPHERAFVTLRQRLGEKILEILVDMSNKKPNDFMDLLDHHIERFYTSMVSDFRDSPNGKETFFRALIRSTPMPIIGRGHGRGKVMTLGGYVMEQEKRQLETGTSEGSNPDGPQQSTGVEPDQPHPTTGQAEEKRAKPVPLIPVYYLERSPAVGQYHALIMEKDWPVIMANHPAYVPLLNAFASINPRVAVRNIAEVMDLYLDKGNDEKFAVLRNFYLNEAPGANITEVKISRFNPPHIPAIAVSYDSQNNQAAEVLEHLMQTAGGTLGAHVQTKLRELSDQARYGTRVTRLLLNEGNPLVQQLQQLSVSDSGIDDRTALILRDLCNMALAFSDPLTAESRTYFEVRQKILSEFAVTSQDLERTKRDKDQLKEQFRQKTESMARLESEIATLAVTAQDLERTEKEKDQLKEQFRQKAESMARLESEIATLRRSQNQAQELTSGQFFLLLTDLKGSTPLVAWMDREESATIFKRWADKAAEIICTVGGVVEKFTGDGLFAYFQRNKGDNPREMAARVAEVAVRIHTETNALFNSEDVRNALLNSAVQAMGCRTGLHYGSAQAGSFGGRPTLFGKSVVCLFRLLEQGKEYFDSQPGIVMTETFKTQLNLSPEPTKLEGRFAPGNHLPELAIYLVS